MRTASESAAFSPDGKRIVTASADKTALLWDVASGRRLRAIKGHTDSVNTAVFSPDGKLVVTASDDGTARLWDVASGRSLQTLARHRPRGQRGVQSGREARGDRER